MCPVFLQQFNHDAMRGLRMDESYETVDTAAGRFVDQADSAGAQIFQGLSYVGHGEAEVVRTFAPPRKEAGGTALFVSRRQEFDRSVVCVEEGDLDAVSGRVEPLQEAEAEDVAVGCEGIIEVLNDDADVVDLGVG